MTEHYNQLDPNQYPLPSLKTPFSLEGHWQPWYDDRRDYNTNAPTYYDYLSNFNKLYKDIVELLNRVARRNISVEDANCINLTKIHDWIDEGDACHTYHDVITLKADVILSNYQKVLNFDGGEYRLNNLISCLSDGLYSPDYLQLLEHLKDKLNKEIANRIEADNNLRNELTQYIDNKISEVNNTINGINTNLTNRLNQLQNALQKIVTNLYEGGNATSSDINNFNINNKIAAGNINLYGGTTDGTSLIRTHKGQAENDVTIGAKG